MGVEQLKEFKRLQKENDRQRRAFSDLTLDKLILKGGARSNVEAPPVFVLASIMCKASSKSWSVKLVGCWGNIALNRNMTL
jgi:hypothetical protein